MGGGKHPPPHPYLEMVKITNNLFNLGYGILLFALALGFFILTRLDRPTLQNSNRDSHKDSEQSDRHSAVKPESGGKTHKIINKN